MSFYWTLGSIPGLGTLESTQRRRALNLALAQIPARKRVGALALGGGAGAALAVVVLGRGPATAIEFVVLALLGSAGMFLAQQVVLRWALQHVPASVARIRGEQLNVNV